MDKKMQIEELQQQIQQRAQQLLSADHLAGKIQGAIEILQAQIQEEEATPKERAAKEKAA